MKFCQFRKYCSTENCKSERRFYKNQLSKGGYKEKQVLRRPFLTTAKMWQLKTAVQINAENTDTLSNLKSACYSPANVPPLYRGSKKIKKILKIKKWWFFRNRKNMKFCQFRKYCSTGNWIFWRRFYKKQVSKGGYPLLEGPQMTIFWQLLKNQLMIPRAIFMTAQKTAIDKSRQDSEKPKKCCLPSSRFDTPCERGPKK